LLRALLSVSCSLSVSRFLRSSAPPLLCDANPRAQVATGSIAPYFHCMAAASALSIGALYPHCLEEHIEKNPRRFWRYARPAPPPPSAPHPTFTTQQQQQQQQQALATHLLCRGAKGLRKQGRVRGRVGGPLRRLLFHGWVHVCMLRGAPPTHLCVRVYAEVSSGWTWVTTWLRSRTTTSPSAYLCCA
jgi:hypothetical protein